MSASIDFTGKTAVLKVSFLYVFFALFGYCQKHERIKEIKYLTWNNLSREKINMHIYSTIACFDRRKF